MKGRNMTSRSRAKTESPVSFAKMKSLRPMTRPIILLVGLAISLSSFFGWGASAPPALEVAQETAGLAGRLAAVLREFPAESEAGRAASAAKIVALGPKAVADLCGRLAKPGENDDSLVRFALDGVAVYVSRPGAEKERLDFSRSLLQAVREPRDAENAVFLLSLIQRIGRSEAIRPVAGFLKDPALSGPAARALVAIGGNEAISAMLQALPSAPAEAAAAIIQGLGDLRGRAAVKPLLAFAFHGDARLRAAALDALAAIGDPAALDILANVSVTAPSEEREKAAARLMTAARRLFENNRPGESEAICRSFIRNYAAAGETGIRSAALALLVEIRGAGAMDDLKEAARSSDREFRDKALGLVEDLKGSWAVSYWLAALGQGPPDVQADILRLLGRKKDPSALSAVREGLKSDDRKIRLAALEARVRFGGDGLLDDLEPLSASADAAEAALVKDAFCGVAPSLAVPKAASAMDGASAAAQIALIEFLAERQARDHAEAVLVRMKNEDENVRKAAFAALDRVVRARDVTAIVEAITASTSAPETTLLQNALVAAAGQIPEPDGRTEEILAALGKAEGPKRADFLRPLARLGGAKALAAVLAETKRPDPQLQAVALFTLSNWPDESALPELAALAKTATDRKTRSLTIQGIARLIGASEAPPEKKLSQLQEAMSWAVEADQKNAVLAGAAGLKTPEALSFIAGFLDDSALQARAAQAAARAALPGPGFDGLGGFETARILKKALLFIESDYDRAEIERIANGLLVREGFTALFNGKDLAGWKGLVADPPKRAKMTPLEMAKAQVEADAEMRAHWRVLESVLAFDGQGHSLCTLKDYGDFEMFVDWKIGPEGDSGIYLRGSPQVQIWDPAQWPEGSGGLYNNQKNPKNPSLMADRPVGEWNTFHIKMIGERVIVVLNGVLVVDDVVMENYWERDKPIYPAGQIELQAHNTPLFFKNIFLREIAGGGTSQAAPSMTEEEKAEGFVPLFNGRDLTGWMGDTQGYVVENGAIVVSPKSGGNLYTEKEYADFHLRFEFKLTPGANNGIGIRTPPAGDAAYLGMEIQVLDDPAEQYKDLKPYQYHGSIYGVVPAKRGHQRPVGEWNAEEIIVRGRRVMVILNGTTIVDAELDQAAAAGTIDGRDHPGLKRANGHISFCGHGSRVEFRNLRIKKY